MKLRKMLGYVSLLMCAAFVLVGSPAAADDKKDDKAKPALAGIWAQGYGQIYRQGIVWLWRIQRIARSTLCLLTAAIILLIWRIRRGTMPP